MPRSVLRPAAWVLAVAFAVAGAVVAVDRLGRPDAGEEPRVPPVAVVAPVEADREAPEVLADEGEETTVVRPDDDLAVAAKRRFVDVWAFPNAERDPKFLLDTMNPFGQRLRMLVHSIKQRGDEALWYRIYLPIKPNGSKGWVRADDVRASPRPERVVVDLSERSLSLFREGKEVATYSVGIGRTEYPTAVGTFYVWARVPQAGSTGPYGIFALGISGFSEVLSDWPGGGRMALHGTANPGDRGGRVSHGCVRVYNGDMVDLTHLPLGTPVVIER